VKNWINEALEKVGAVCDKKHTKDLEKINNDDEEITG
jgi:hypothetical protein